DEKYPGRMLLAEANQWSEDAVKYFGNGDECHMAFNFPVMPRMFMSIQLEDRFPLVDIMEGAEKIPDSCQWALFLRNHDELTLEMVTDEERDSMYRFYARDPRAKINFGIRRRLAPLLWNNPRKIEIMNMLLFSLPGTPVIYYGDEICMGDNYYLGDRNGVRTPMQWSSYRNAGFSQANPQQLYLPVIIDPEYHYESVNVENQEKNLSSPLWWMKRVIAMRKQYKVFGRGSMRMLSPQNPKILAFVREYKEEKILVVINLSRFSQVAEIDLSDYNGMVPVEVFSHNRFPVITGNPYVFTMGPYNYFWFSLESAGKPVEGGDEIKPRTITVQGGLEKFEQIKKKLEEEVLNGYMRRCRWFGGKSRHIRKLSVIDAAELEVADMSVIAIIDVMYTEGSPEQYFLPVFYSRGENSKKIRDEYPKAVIASVLSSDGEGVLYDGTYSREFHSLMLGLMEKQKKFKCVSGEFTGYSEGVLAKLMSGREAAPASYMFDAEQTNTSVAFGDIFVMKIYRRAEQGMNPDIEIMKALKEKIVSVPALAGYADFVPQKGEVMNFAKLESYTKNEGDAWKYASDNVLKFFERVIARREELEKLASPAHPGINPDEKEVLFKTLCGEFFVNMACLLAKRTA
ncbi:MAG TPA: alpha-glucosidase C-terminal domain-containing protein, partial [Candidatus Goldiibacteriota bacterium]|nr:alpha-glucosidase C-terminal domain-containing protein [Candidatus Goldiibacteriota bacterium]